MDVVLSERRGACTVLTLNRPQLLNTISNPMLERLEAALDAEQDSDSRALVLTGAGRAFCAGSDLSEAHADPQVRIRRVHTLIARLRGFPKPVITAINGLALGGGLELALACTFRVARRGAKLGLPEIKLGLLPAYGGTQLLPRLIGENRALEMMLGGEPVDGATAGTIGLVNRVCEDSDDVVAVATEFAAMITRHSLVPQRAILHAVREGGSLPLDEALALERTLVKEVAGSADTLEGVQAFLEKRPPRWQDR